MGVLLRVATAVIGAAIAAGLAFIIWDAAHSKGLLIEPFLGAARYGRAKALPAKWWPAS